MIRFFSMKYVFLHEISRNWWQLMDMTWIWMELNEHPINAPPRGFSQLFTEKTSSKLNCNSRSGFKRILTIGSFMSPILSVRDPKGTPELTMGSGASKEHSWKNPWLPGNGLNIPPINSCWWLGDGANDIAVLTTWLIHIPPNIFICVWGPIIPWIFHGLSGSEVNLLASPKRRQPFSAGHGASCERENVWKSDSTAVKQWLKWSFYWACHAESLWSVGWPHIVLKSPD